MRAADLSAVDTQPTVANTAGQTNSATAATAKLQLYNGRWWHWNPSRGWSYYQGNNWILYGMNRSPRNSTAARLAPQGGNGAVRYESGYRGTTGASATGRAMNPVLLPSPGYQPPAMAPQSGPAFQPWPPAVGGTVRWHERSTQRSIHSWRLMPFTVLHQPISASIGLPLSEMAMGRPTGLISSRAGSMLSSFARVAK